MEQSLLPLLPHLLQLAPNLTARVLEFFPQLLGQRPRASVLAARTRDAPAGDDAELAAEAPAVDVGALDVLGAGDVDDAAPLALALAALAVRELLVGGEAGPHGAHGALVRGDGVPGRAEEAGEVEGGGHEEGDEGGQAGDGGGDYAGVGQVHLGAGGGGGGGGGQEGGDVGPRRGQLGGQDEEVGEALGRLVGLGGAQALQVVQREVVRVGGRAREPDDARLGGHEGREPVREQVVPEDVGGEDLAEGRLGGGGFGGACGRRCRRRRRRRLSRGHGPDAADLVGRIGGGVEEIRAQLPQRPGPVEAGPASDAGVADQGIDAPAALQQLVRQRLDRRQLGEVDRDAFELDPGLQEKTGVGCAAIGRSEGALQVSVELLQRLLCLLRVSCREEDVDGLGLRPGVEEVIDETAAYREAQPADRL